MGVEKDLGYNDHEDGKFKTPERRNMVLSAYPKLAGKFIMNQESRKRLAPQITQPRLVYSSELTLLPSNPILKCNANARRVLFVFQ
ncbi:hypothetical protein EYC84_011449 [Monilinia fructicola]|uniref:Uncharacterized protein n=1 Tax=Monilinia fructicola TaxID=38448 RepID=A0A5M9JA51_MONFR|nr:hypothetical protein EYC84_011449 [Monilinia fructicola]